MVCPGWIWRRSNPIDFDDPLHPIALATGKTET
jgi:hypothetical protein